MFRVVVLAGQVYSLTIPSIEDDLENIQGFIDEGNVIILTDDLQDLKRCGIDPDDVIDADDEART